MDRKDRATFLALKRMITEYLQDIGVQPDNCGYDGDIELKFQGILESHKFLRSENARSADDRRAEISLITESIRKEFANNVEFISVDKLANMTLGEISKMIREDE